MSIPDSRFLDCNLGNSFCTSAFIFSRSCVPSWNLSDIIEKRRKNVQIGTELESKNVVDAIHCNYDLMTININNVVDLMTVLL